MGATFSRVKNWAVEILTNTDLNAEIDNILNNLDPSGVDDYSVTVTQMRLTTDPGESGTESQATSLAGELERLRFVLKEIKGTNISYWYQSASVSLYDLSLAIGNSLPNNRIVSGKMSASSSQLIALAPSGTTTSITLDAAPTGFSYYVNGVQYNVTADVTITGLSAAPATNNTATISVTPAAADEQYTQLLGEYGTSLPIAAAGSEIASLVNKYAAFSINNGAQTEYMIAYINSTTSLTKAWRGCFNDSTQTPVKKVVFTNGDVVTLLKLGWVFANTASSVVVTYTVPTYNYTAPAGPNTGDYWYDLTNDLWKTFDSSSWVTASSTLVGMCAQTSAACVAARTFDQFASVSDACSVEIEWLSNTVVQAKNAFAYTNIFGSVISFGVKLPTWDIAANLDSGLVEAASTWYYLYLDENGKPIISDLVPTDLRGSRRGLYHPTETWRCLGRVRNDASSNFDKTALQSFTNLPVSGPLATVPTAADGLSYAIKQSVASNTLSIGIYDRYNDYPSDLAPCVLSFQNVTSRTAGTKLLSQIYSPLTLNVVSAATLGHTSGPNQYIWTYAVNASGSFGVAVSGVQPYDDGTPRNIGAMAASSTAGTTIYGTASATSASVTLIGRITVAEAVAGTWATAPTEVALGVRPRRVCDEPVQYTPTIAGFGTGASPVTGSATFFWSWREGKHLIIHGRFIPGTPTAVGATLTIGYQAGNGNVTVDTSVVSTTMSLGMYAGNLNGAMGHMVYNSVFAFGQCATTAASPLQGANGDTISSGGGAGGQVTLFMRVPINGWHEYGP